MWFATKLAFTGMGAAIAHWSEGAIILALCVAGELGIGVVTAYVPLLKPLTKKIQLGLLAVAIGTALVLFGEWVGARDAIARCDARAAVVQTEVTTQVNKAKQNPGTDRWITDK